MQASEYTVYPKYFGLKEPSFSITPDPQYLFLSGQHREALAHLLYGAGEVGGFVLLSGEVGTGKTTVCRAFLEQLPDDVDVALVVNPAMTAAELLHSICDEFRVQLPASGEPSVKVMLDHLNRFLLDAHARGRRPVLIIDEAQNLRPKVMEQVRLLTNLETAKQKLLQIFLIGQPELRTLLASRELRQLNQRITARYHLAPLSAKETAAYIEHRIAVAGVERPLFTAKALKRVHRRSGGVPRLINLLCDRALLGAAVSRRMQVTPDIVDSAAREVIDRADPARPRQRSRLGLAAAVLAALALGIWIGGSSLPQRLPGALGEQWAAALGWPQADAPVAATSDPSAADSVLAEDSAHTFAAAEALAEDASNPKRPLFAANVGLEPLPGGDAEPSRAPDPAPSADASSPDPMLTRAAAGDGPDVAAPAVPDAPDSSPAIGRGASPGAQAAAESHGSANEASTSPAPEQDAAVAAATDQPLADALALGKDAGLHTPRIAMARVTAAPKLPTLTADELPRALVDEDAVVDELLRLWEVETAPGVRHLDCAAVPAFALACERSEGRWSDLRRFDRPAALKLVLADGQPAFVVVGGLDEEHALLHRDGVAMRVPIATLDERWSGDYLLLWRTPPFGGRIIGRTDSADAIAWLRERLALLPDSDLTVDPARYDADVVAAVRRFQSAQGLRSDGVVGPRTLMMLSNVLADLDVPRLSHSQ